MTAALMTSVLRFRESPSPCAPTGPAASRGRRLDDRVSERLEERDTTILVGIRDVFRQCVDEELRKMRLVPLERALRRRDDDPIRRREHRQHVAARAREIDERDALRREATE